MANEHLLSDSGDVRLTEAMAQEYALILGDRFSLYGHPAFHYAGNCAQRGSNVLKVPLLGYGLDRMASIAENASATNTLVSDASVTITVGRQFLQRSISDLNDMVDGAGLNVQGLISDGVTAYTGRWMEMACNLLDGFSNTASPGTGAALTFSNFLAAQFTLIQNSVAGPYLCVLYGKQYTDLITSIRSETGPVANRSDAQSIFSSAGVGFHGTLNEVEIVTSSLVLSYNSGADSAGAMIGAGAIAWANGTARQIRGGSEVIIPAGVPMFTEIERDASGALTRVVHNAYQGFAELQDGAGVTIISDR